MPRVRTQIGPSSYLKIAEGCDHRCAFCIIPYLRGDMKFRTIEDVVLEAKKLVEGGAKEIVLVSQDSTAYGTDIYKRRAKWIRIMYHLVRIPKYRHKVFKEPYRTELT